MKKTLPLFQLVACFLLLSFYSNAQNDITTRVYVDVNGNGVDDGETGITGLTPILYNDINGDGVAQAGEDTGIVPNDLGTGEYTFANVVDGDYIIGYPDPGNNQVPTRESLDPPLIVDGDSDIEISRVGPNTDYTTIQFVMAGAPIIEVDAGFVVPVNIGDFVFYDYNGNGINDGEPGIGGVDVRLINNLTGLDEANDAFGSGLINPMPTDASGNYSFMNIFPGDYSVEFTDATGTYYLTIADVTGATGDLDATDDSDAVWVAGSPHSGSSASVVVLSGETDEEERIDAGFVTEVEIGDFVWEDANGNGVQDGGEAGVDGAEMTLNRVDGLPFNDLDGNPYPTPTVTSAGGGFYSFTMLPPGDYEVSFSTLTNLPDWYLTIPDYSGAVGPDGIDDSDAVEDGGRQTGMVADVTAHIDGANPMGDEVTRVDAGIYNPVSLGDMVWHDQIMNGLQDEAPLEGVQGINVTLYDDAGVMVVSDASGAGLTNPTMTDAAGMYTFDLVPPIPGQYYIEFSGAGGDWYLTQMSDLSGAGPDGLDDSDAVFVSGTWQSGQTLPFSVFSENSASYEDNTMRIDAGFYDPATIGDMVWHDLNGNGLQDDAPLGGPTDEFDVELNAVGPSLLGSPQPTEDAEGNALPLMTTTVGGMYMFENLQPGQYRVTFTKPGAVPEYFFTEQDATGAADEATDVDNDSDADLVSGETHDINLESREDDNGGINETERIDAGVFRCNTIGGNWWLDANGNGIQDGGIEGPEPGITLALRDATTMAAVTDCEGNVIGDQVTDGAGEYKFEKVPPGEYYVELVSLANGADFVTVNPHANGNMDDNDDDVDSDFDPTATPIITHTIVVTSEETFDGSGNDIGDAIQIDGGINRPAAIEIFLWHDANGDGQYQASGDECGENPMEDGEITIMIEKDGATAKETDGTTDATAVSQGGGVYLIENLPAGTGYQIILAAGAWQETNPHYDGSTADVGDGEDDSDFQNGMSPMFELIAGPVKTNIDGGFWKFMTVGGFVWKQGNDADGVFDPGVDSRADGVRVNIYGDFDMDGVFDDFIEDDITGMPDGDYEFDGLPPGDYRIELDKDNFGAPLSPLQVFMPLSTVFDPNDDKTDQNDGTGFNAAGGVEAVPVQLRCGCEPEDDGLTNRTIDIGVFFEFDCGETPDDYLALDCDETDPTNPDHNPFFPICDVVILDAFCATMTDVQTGNGPDPLCANGGSPHNISWFSFVAGEGTYDLQVTPGNCGGPSSSGIQNGIYTDCTFSQEIQCQGLPCSVAPIVLNNRDADGDYQLIPGEVYHWFLDGCAGSVCEFEIDVLGDFIPFEPDPPTDLLCSGTNVPVDCESESVCPGETITFTLEGIEIENINYLWSVSPDDGWMVIEPNDQDEMLTNFNNIEIQFNPDLQPGESITYTVCWESLNAKCYSLVGPLCKEITVERLDNEDFGVVELCEFDLFSFTGPKADESGNTDPNGDGLEGWQNVTYVFSEGQHCLPVVLPDGCEYEECVEIIVLPNPPIARVDTVFCEGELPGDVFGFTMPPQNDVISGFNLRPDILASNGCDSIIDLYVWYMEIHGDLTGECGTNSDGETVYNLTFNEDLSMRKDAGAETVWDYKWYRTDFGVGPGFDLDDGDPDGDPYTFIADQEGQWELHIGMTVNDDNTGLPVSGCTYIFMINVDASTFLPPNPVLGNWDLMPCAVGNPPEEYIITSGVEDTPTWTWPSDVTSASGQGTDTLTIDWNGSAGGDISVFVSNQCGNSDTLVQTVTLVSVPDPEIIIDLDTTCIDSVFTIQAGGAVVTGGTYNWNFSGGVVQGGPATGPGPHRVSWSNEGTFEVSLMINIGDCESIIARDTVSTVGPIAAPVIICGGSTINSASFTWTEVPGATGYIVEIVKGPSSNVGGQQTATTYTMSDMDLNEGAIIRVIALTDNPCGNTEGISLECFAQLCPQETITLGADQTQICLTSSTQPIDINVAWDGAEPPGSGVFSVVPGIADGSVAQFDPVAAGVGTHTIIYTFTGTGDTYDGCIYNGQITFEVFQTPTSDFTVVGDNICIDQISTITYTGNTNNGLYTWVVTPDGGPLDGIGPFDITWPSAGQKSVSLTVERDGCTSEPTDATINVDPLVEPIVLECKETSATSVTFGWNSPANASEYELMVDRVSVPNRTDNEFTVDGLTPGDEVELIIVALSDNLCNNTADTIVCIAQNCPAFTLSTSNDTTLCSDATAFDLSWSITGGLQDGSGEHKWSGTGITDSLAGTFDPQISGLGTFRINLDYVEGPDGACPGSAFLDVSVIDVPVVSYDLSDDTICLSETIRLTYTGTPASLQPMISTTGGTLNSAGGRNFAWTFDTPGTYEVTAEAFVGDCIGTPLTRTVVVEPEPMEEVMVRCAAADLDFVSFEWNDIGCADEYEVFINGASVGIQPDLSYRVDGLNENDQVDIRVEPINTCSCATLVAGEQTCVATACPPIQVSIAASQNEICIDDTPGATIQITETITGQDGGGVSTWFGENVDQNGVFTPAGLAAGDYEIRFLYEEQGGSCSDEATTVITINSNPIGTVAKMDPVCFNNNVGSARIGFLIEGADYDVALNGSTVSNLLQEGLDPGDYSVLFTDKDNGCTSTENFTIFPAPEVTAEIVGDMVILKGESTVLRVEHQPLQNVDSIQWTNTTTGESIPCSDPECEAITVSPEDDAEYCAIIFFNDGCSVDACAQVRVNLDPDVTIPNIFNPSETSNSLFYVKHNGKFSMVKKMLIYDRWGEMVFEDSEIPANEVEDRGWDGTFKGREVNPGVYVYLIEIIDTNPQTGEIIEQPLIFTGDVTVIR